MLNPGLERTNLRALLGVRCLVPPRRRISTTCDASASRAFRDDLLGVLAFLQSECEAAVDVADQVERTVAGRQLRQRAFDAA